MRISMTARWMGALAFVATAQALAHIDATQPVMSRDRLVELLVAHPEVTDLDQVPALLPGDFRMNFILKHGVKRVGERGHLVERVVSQSAEPLAPRAILYDERSGFSLSFNGGGQGQTSPHRLDMLSFDAKTKAFSLEQIDFPIEPGQPQVTTSDCNTCHGPRGRPIFSMYPDWPAFYGSDNDELTGSTLVQQKEFADYRRFRDTIANTHPRYQPLFADENVRRYLGRAPYPSYPYRPDNSTQSKNVSRAFAFRPELRMGVLYNRLNAQNTEVTLKAHPRYKEFAPYFLFNLLQCSWSPSAESARKAWTTKAAQALGQKPRLLSGGLLDYRQNWALFGLRVNDVDIRYSYNHEGYSNNDASKKVMEVGYIGRYFNSYFDGSATIDELVAARLYTDLSTGQARLKAPIKLWGLVDKYEHFADRFRFDEAFFRQMDRLGRWIHIPFPKELSKVHHRETFTTEFGKQHQALCGTLQKELAR